MFEWLKKSWRGKEPKAVPQTKVVSSDFLQWLFNNVAPHKWGGFESHLKAGSGQVWATWKAVDLVAQSVMDTDWDLYRPGASQPVDVPDIENLLVRPNEFMRGTDLLYLTTFHLKLTGNAYWMKADQGARGLPKAIFPLNPKRMEIATNNSGQVIGYIQRLTNGKRVTFLPEEIIHFRRIDPNNDYYGLGDVEAGKSLLEDHINRTTWNAGFWKNGASPSGLLVCEDQIADEDEWERAKKKWQAEYGGENNAGKTAWLTGQWKYMQLGLSNADMQGIENTKLNTDQIFLLHGVPLSVAGIQGAANYATAELDDQRFRKYCVKPMITLLEESIQEGLIRPAFPNLELRFNVTGLIALGTVVPHIAQLFDRGCISPNEAREMVGLSKVENNPLFDQTYIVSSLIPTDLAGVPAPGGQADQAAAAIVQRQTRELLNAKP